MKLLLIVRRHSLSVFDVNFFTFSTSSSKPRVRMLPNLIYKYIGWFSLRFVHFMSKSQILYFCWIFCHFWLKLIFSTSSSKRQVRVLPNLIYKYLGWFSLRFVNFVEKSQFLWFWWIFLSFLVKIDIFDFFFKSASQSAFKFDIQVPWVVLSPIC